MTRLSDIEIAHAANMRPISEIAASVGLGTDEFEPYGRYKAKIDAESVLKKPLGKEKLILVTAINPTPAGEGKTTTTIGLADGMRKLGKHVVVALREPSLGPVFGIKGGAAGGGYAQVVPMEDINLHFTGDFHAITSANNLLAAMLDNHIHQGNKLDIDVRQIVWKRCTDMNDRQLRNTICGLGGKGNGVPREDGFDISVASEIMAIFCLAKDLKDLRSRIGRIIVAYNRKGSPVTAHDLKAEGAMTVLLKDAIKPNLVQTLEGTPCLIHGGPFANIAHGCNSVLATQCAMHLGDYTITEAGFGADLGAEKFLDIKCRMTGLEPSAVVIVATIRALKHHGGSAKDEWGTENLQTLQKGMPNLLRHIDNIRNVYHLPCVVAINAFDTDTEAEINCVRHACEAAGVDVALSTVHENGGEGGVELAKKVIALSDSSHEFHYSYELDGTIEHKLRSIAQNIYRADDITITPAAAKQIRQLTGLGFDHLPVCIAKTQYSFSDDPHLLGAPDRFKITIRSVKVSAGAGFLVALTGDVMTMPGLPECPAAERIDIDENNQIIGLF